MRYKFARPREHGKKIQLRVAVKTRERRGEATTKRDGRTGRQTGSKHLNKDDGSNSSSIEWSTPSTVMKNNGAEKKC